MEKFSGPMPAGRILRLLVGGDVPFEIARGSCAVGVSVGFLYLAPQDGHLLAKREVLQSRGEGSAEVAPDLSAPSKPTPVQLRPEVTAWSCRKARASRFRSPRRHPPEGYSPTSEASLGTPPAD